MNHRAENSGGGGPVTSLPEALATLVAWRDRLTEAVGVLSPLIGAAAPAVELEQLPARRPVRALPAPKPGRVATNGKVATRGNSAALKPAKRPAKGKGSRPRVTPETIAKIQAMDGQGKPIAEIAAACGVSTGSVRKFADMKPVARPAGNGTASVPAAPAKRAWV